MKKEIHPLQKKLLRQGFTSLEYNDVKSMREQFMNGLTAGPKL